MPSERTQRAIDAVIAAWPPLGDDPVYVEQLVLVALRAAGDPRHLPDRASAELPGWLVNACTNLHRDQQGVALGFAAAGYVAGRSDCG